MQQDRTNRRTCPYCGAELPEEASFTATLGCLSNVGPGLDTVGPLASFSPLSEFNKVFLSLFMLIGRLEIFPILLLFHPSTWRRS